MPRIIKHDRVVEDDWQVLTLAAGETPATVTLPALPFAQDALAPVISAQTLSKIGRASCRERV